MLYSINENPACQAERSGETEQMSNAFDLFEFSASNLFPSDLYAPIFVYPKTSDNRTSSVHF